MTQGGPISPTIFNMFVDVLLLHCLIVVAATEEEVYPGAADTEGFRRYTQMLVAYFYADDGILA